MKPPEGSVGWPPFPQEWNPVLDAPAIHEDIQREPGMDGAAEGWGRGASERGS